MRLLLDDKHFNQFFSTNLEAQFKKYHSPENFFRNDTELTHSLIIFLAALKTYHPEQSDKVESYYHEFKDRYIIRRYRIGLTFENLDAIHDGITKSTEKFFSHFGKISRRLSTFIPKALNR